MAAFNSIAIVISLVGSFIIIWGVIRTTFCFLTMEWHKLFNKQIVSNDEIIRYGFGSYLLLGLDFMLAADMIHTIHNPVLNELYILALIVAIRSIISFFLHKEINAEYKNVS